MQTSGNDGVSLASATSGARCDRNLGRRAVGPLLNVERQRAGQDAGELVHAGPTRSRPRTSPPRSPHVIVGCFGSATNVGASPVQVPAEMCEAHMAVMEMSLDREAILGGWARCQEVGRPAAT